MILNCLNPKFSKKFVLDYYFEMVQRLKFCVYDIDNDTYDLADDDFLGEIECTLGQVNFPRPRLWQFPLTFFFYCFEMSARCLCFQIVSNRQMTRSLLLKDKRPAGRGTITVSGVLSHLCKSQKW